MTEAYNPFVLFEIRNDKDRGNLIITIRQDGSDNVCFFKYQHQPIRQHPEIMQQIVGASKPTNRTKTIRVNIQDFSRQYWNGVSFEFKGVEMNSMEKEKNKVHWRLINKEVGAIKRKETIAETKQKKLDEKNKKISEQWKSDEAAFQVERARRIAELFKGRGDQKEQQTAK